MTTDVDTETLPTTGLKPFVHSVSSAPAYWMQDGLWIMLTDATETGVRFSLMEQLFPKGTGPGPHKHTWSDETYYILDGEITFLIGDEIHTARTGDFVVVPRDTRHAFRIDSETARFLNGYTPASMEALIADIGTPTTQRNLPPRGLKPAADRVPKGKYGLDWLPGPDPLRPNGH
jgi:quercetin dioxygenase-like cupin family protein